MEQPKKRGQEAEEGERSCRKEMMNFLFKLNISIKLILWDYFLEKNHSAKFCKPQYNVSNPEPLKLSPLIRPSLSEI